MIESSLVSDCLNNQMPQFQWAGFSMPFDYAEARKIVFLEMDIVAALLGHENYNSDQPVPFGFDSFTGRPEWTSSFLSDASAQRHRGTVPWTDVNLEMPPARLGASGNFGRPASN